MKPLILSLAKNLRERKAERVSITHRVERSSMGQFFGHIFAGRLLLHTIERSNGASADIAAADFAGQLQTELEDPTPAASASPIATKLPEFKVPTQQGAWNIYLARGFRTVFMACGTSYFELPHNIARDVSDVLKRYAGNQGSGGAACQPLYWDGRKLLIRFQPKSELGPAEIVFHGDFLLAHFSILEALAIGHALGHCASALAIQTSAAA